MHTREGTVGLFCETSRNSDPCTVQKPTLSHSVIMQLSDFLMVNGYECNK